MPDVVMSESEEKPCPCEIFTRLRKPVLHQSLLNKMHLALENYMVLHEWDR